MWIHTLSLVFILAVAAASPTQLGPLHNVAPLVAAEVSRPDVQKAADVVSGEFLDVTDNGEADVIASAAAESVDTGTGVLSSWRDVRGVVSSDSATSKPLKTASSNSSTLASESSSSSATKDKSTNKHVTKATNRSVVDKTGGGNSTATLANSDKNVLNKDAAQQSTRGSHTNNNVNKTAAHEHEKKRWKPTEHSPKRTSTQMKAKVSKVPHQKGAKASDKLSTKAAKKSEKVLPKVSKQEKITTNEHSETTKPTNVEANNKTETKSHSERKPKLSITHQGNAIAQRTAQPTTAEPTLRKKPDSIKKRKVQIKARKASPKRDAHTVTHHERKVSKSSVKRRRVRHRKLRTKKRFVAKAPAAENSTDKKEKVLDNEKTRNSFHKKVNGKPRHETKVHATTAPKTSTQTPKRVTPVLRKHQMSSSTKRARTTKTPKGITQVPAATKPPRKNNLPSLHKLQRTTVAVELHTTIRPTTKPTHISHDKTAIDESKSQPRNRKIQHDVNGAPKRHRHRLSKKAKMLRHKVVVEKKAARNAKKMKKSVVEHASTASSNATSMLTRPKRSVAVVANEDNELTGKMEPDVEEFFEENNEDNSRSVVFPEPPELMEHDTSTDVLASADVESGASTAVVPEAPADEGSEDPFEVEEPIPELLPPPSPEEIALDEARERAEKEEEKRKMEQLRTSTTTTTTASTASEKPVFMGNFNLTSDENVLGREVEKAVEKVLMQDNNQKNVPILMEIEPESGKALHDAQTPSEVVNRVREQLKNKKKNRKLKKKILFRGDSRQYPQDLNQLRTTTDTPALDRLPELVTPESVPTQVFPQVRPPPSGSRSQHLLPLPAPQAPLNLQPPMQNQRQLFFPQQELPPQPRPVQQPQQRTPMWFPAPNIPPALPQMNPVFRQRFNNEQPPMMQQQRPWQQAPIYPPNHQQFGPRNMPPQQHFQQQQPKQMQQRRLVPASLPPKSPLPPVHRDFARSTQDNVRPFSKDQLSNAGFSHYKPPTSQTALEILEIVKELKRAQNGKDKPQSFSVFTTSKQSYFILPNGKVLVVAEESKLAKHKIDDPDNIEEAPKVRRTRVPEQNGEARRVEEQVTKQMYEKFGKDLDALPVAAGAAASAFAPRSVLPSSSGAKAPNVNTDEPIPQVVSPNSKQTDTHEIVPVTFPPLNEDLGDQAEPIVVKSGNGNAAKLRLVTLLRTRVKQFQKQ